MRLLREKAAASSFTPPQDGEKAAEEERGDRAAHLHHARSEKHVLPSLGIVVVAKQNDLLDRRDAPTFGGLEQKQWGHPSVVMIAKPDGRMARYLYGLEFLPQDLKLGLLEASEGRSISTVEQIILFCYHYDPQGGKYVLVARRVMQVGGGAVAVVLFGFLGLFWGRELRKKKKTQATNPIERASDVPSDVTV